jgi:hypothetical protein
MKGEELGTHETKKTSRKDAKAQRLRQTNRG